MYIPFIQPPHETMKTKLKRFKLLLERLLNHQNLNKTFCYKLWKAYMDEFDYGVSFTLRYKYLEKYSFVILTTETISLLAEAVKDNKVLEVGAGTGYLSNLLALRGINITAIDNFSHQTSGGYTFNEVSLNVIDQDVKDHPVENYDVVILSWPHDGMETLNKMVSGQILIYQGEGIGGCTGSEMFHETIYDESQFVEIKHDLNKYHIQFDGVHDNWYIYRKV